MITIGDRDIDGVVLDPVRMPEVTGRVTVEGNPVSPGVVNSIMLRSAQNGAGGRVSEDGSFRVTRVVPGPYQVTVSLRGSYYVRSIEQGGVDLRDAGIVVGDTLSGPLLIDLSPHGGTIEGVLALPDSAAEPMLIALLRRRGEDVVLEKQAYINASVAVLNGKTRVVVPSPSAVRAAPFTMQGVPPGEYLLFAWPAAAQIEFASQDFLLRYGASGKSITVGEDATVGVTLEPLLPRTN
jgi:hypothetical protein